MARRSPALWPSLLLLGLALCLAKPASAQQGECCKQCMRGGLRRASLSHLVPAEWSRTDPRTFRCPPGVPNFFSLPSSFRALVRDQATATAATAEPLATRLTGLDSNATTRTNIPVNPLQAAVDAATLGVVAQSFALVSGIL